MEKDNCHQQEGTSRVDQSEKFIPSLWDPNPLKGPTFGDIFKILSIESLVLMAPETCPYEYICQNQDNAFEPIAAAILEKDDRK